MQRVCVSFDLFAVGVTALERLISSGTSKRLCGLGSFLFQERRNQASKQHDRMNRPVKCRYMGRELK